MEKIRIKDYWKERDLILTLSNDKKIVAIGEILSENAERYLQIDINDFMNFIKQLQEEIEHE